MLETSLVGSGSDLTGRLGTGGFPNAMGAVDRPNGSALNF